MDFKSNEIYNRALEMFGVKHMQHVKGSYRGGRPKKGEIVGCSYNTENDIMLLIIHLDFEYTGWSYHKDDEDYFSKDVEKMGSLCEYFYIDKIKEDK